MSTAQFVERLGDLLGAQVFVLGDVRVTVGSLLTAILIVLGAFLLARLVGSPRCGDQDRLPAARRPLRP